MTVVFTWKFFLYGLAVWLIGEHKGNIWEGGKKTSGEQVGKRKNHQLRNTSANQVAEGKMGETNWWDFSSVGVVSASSSPLLLGLHTLETKQLLKSTVQPLEGSPHPDTTYSSLVRGNVGVCRGTRRWLDQDHQPSTTLLQTAWGSQAPPLDAPQAGPRWKFSHGRWRS